jgi:hypothetical protein
MTQIAGLLVVATVFTRSMVCNIYILQSEGGLICETKLPMQELELKMQGGGLMREGGRNCGILRYMYISMHGMTVLMC